MRAGTSRLVVTRSDDDERAHTRRYTEDGINVVALDRHGRGLHRARPERRFPTGRISRLFEPPRSWVPSLIFVALVLAALGLAIHRLTS
jgi:hypothetical protein